MALELLAMVALLAQPSTPAVQVPPCPPRAEKIKCDFFAVVEFVPDDTDDCGTSWFVPARPRRLDQKALDCVLDHIDTGAPFLFHEMSWGTDSAPGYALVQTSPGKLEVFWYDSNPGGDLCGSGSSLRRAECHVQLQVSTGSPADRFGFLRVPKGLKFPHCSLGPWQAICANGVRVSEQP